MEFALIEITESTAFNLGFTFPIYAMFIALPFLALLQIIKKI